MKKSDIMKLIAICSIVLVVGMFAYVVKASNMISYFSEDVKVCINCHTMYTQFATWQHSSHRERATCVECHLPKESLVSKIIAKSADGYNHSVAMTFKTYEGNNIRISKNAKKRIQANCIRCHKEIVSQIISNSKLYQSNKASVKVERMCWNCHRSVPHGMVRSLTTTPDNIGVKDI